MIDMFTHHAVVVVSDSLEAASLPDVYAVPSTDVAHILSERFSIAEARQLQKDALARPFEAPRRTFVIVTRELPLETQNALLKLFEEPPHSTHFIVVIPRVDMLIPTLRSRVYIVGAGVSDDTPHEQFTLFQAAPVAIRLEMVAKLAADKDTATMEVILRGAEAIARQQMVHDPSLLTHVVMLRDFFTRSGASRKMLLEELALLLPHA